MYSEGSSKGMLAILGAILLVIGAIYWRQSLFILGFIWDLMVIDSRPILDNIGQFISNHWPF
jgi:hypothetical protein